MDHHGAQPGTRRRHFLKRSITIPASLLAVGVLPVPYTAGTAHTATATPAAVLIGARSDTGFTGVNQAIGPLGATRFYYTGKLPASFAGSKAAKLPAGVVPVISYNQATTNVVSYVKSVNRPIWLAYRHEPEDGHQFSSGSVYVSQFEGQSRLIRSVGNHNVKVASINAGYAYRNGRGLGLNGSYLPPASYVDAYALDLYQVCCRGGRWPAKGLASYDRFQNWLKLVGSRGKPLGLTEYGIEASASARDARIQTDAGYLRSRFGGKFGLWDYYYIGIWRFTDAATIQTWRSLATSARNA